MSFDWGSYEEARVNVVSWPKSQPINASVDQTQWKVETFSDLSPKTRPLLESESLRGVSSEISVTLHVVGPRLLDMTFFCPISMEDPFRLAAASRIWIFLDENVTRLWKIGAYPRAFFPEFMKQRRLLVGEVRPSLRSAWLWLSMIRTEPLMAAVANRSSRVDWLLCLLKRDGSDSELAAFFADLQSAVSAGRGVREVFRALDVTRPVARAIDFGLRGVEQNSTDLMAHCTESLFGIMHDMSNSLDKWKDGGFLREEDRLWFDDARRLAMSNTFDASIIDRSGEYAKRMSSFCDEFDFDDYPS